MNETMEIIIEPNKGIKHYWSEIWQYRELFAFLAWRDILLRYKQTAVGISWTVLRPFLTMFVFTVIFGMIAKLPSEGVPYAILVFSAMLPWQFSAEKANTIFPVFCCRPALYSLFFSADSCISAKQSAQLPM